MNSRLAPPVHTDAPPLEGLPHIVRALRIVHPFPTLLNVSATAGLAFVAAGGTPDVSVLVRMIGVMLFAQSGIGITNDLFDRELDVRTKPWKPLISGHVRPSTAVGLALALVASTAAVAVTLGVASFSLAMLGLACGLAYDVRFKRSIFSAVPFMIAIPTLPVWIWVTLGAWQPSVLWVLPLGALIGLALHLANTLPDLDDDAKYGVKGLAHRLGAGWSAVVGWSSFALAVVTSIALVPALDYNLTVYAPAAVFGMVCLGGAVGLYMLRRDNLALQIGFGAIGVASAVVAVGWLAAVA